MLDRLEAYDLGMLYWFTSWRAPWLNEALLWVTMLGDVAVLVAAALAGAAGLLLLRQGRLAAAVLAAGLLAISIDWFVKPAVARPRPDIRAALAEPPASASFPSSHAMGSMAVYATLALMFGRLWPRLWLALLAPAVCLSLIVGLTRVMIGVHYPFDVLGGWIAGLLCVSVAVAAAGPRRGGAE
jgi:undecaprenyl-diphosphatase